MDRYSTEHCSIAPATQTSACCGAYSPLARRRRVVVLRHFVAVLFLLHQLRPSGLAQALAQAQPSQANISLNSDVHQLRPAAGYTKADRVRPVNDADGVTRGGPSAAGSGGFDQNDLSLRRKRASHFNYQVSTTCLQEQRTDATMQRCNWTKVIQIF